MNASAPPPALHLRIHPGVLAVVRLPSGASLPPWAGAPEVEGSGTATGPLHVVARTAEETSLVVPADRVPDRGDAAGPPATAVETGFRAMSVAGPLDFALVGILARLCAALADAGVPVFVVSTFDTDWLLVRDERLEDAKRALRAAGAVVDEPGRVPASADGPATRSSPGGR